jgi:hypothetical protein
MRALILSILVTFTACVTGDNLEASTDDDIVDVEDLPPLTQDQGTALAERLDELGDVLEAFLLADTPFAPPTTPDAQFE